MPDIVWLAVTFVAMLILAYGKRVISKHLGNDILTTERRVNFIDAYLA